MKRERLERTFCRKISGELKLFKCQMLMKRKEAVYQSAYQIDSTICIYELLAEMSRYLSEDTLKAAAAFPGLLPFLYGRWLEYKDFHMKDIQCCMERELAEIRKNYQKERRENYEKISSYSKA